jgi:PPK2 family polyphosphate:nucleotide phosphotransferase
MPQPIVVKPKIKLKDFDPAYSGDLEKDEARERTTELCKRLRDLQNLLYANSRHALLVIFQGMDASGKDGAGRRLLEYVDPAGVEVVSFKTPSKEEDAHDFLWRIHKAAPRFGNIGVFNRSHYEEVLIDRVLGWEPETVWRPRYEMINAFERILTANGTILLKFFLHISKEEQAERLERRRLDPTKVWKFDPADLKMREKWGDFMDAYQDALNECSPVHAPWHVVPANKKWFRDFVIVTHVVEALERLNLKWPKPKVDVSGMVVK